MKNNIVYFVIASFLALALGNSGCYSDVFSPEPIVIDPIDTISLSNDIVPLFESGCNLSICHATGAVSPDLTPPNAYRELISNGYTNVDQPLESELYLWLIGEGSRDIMPPVGRDEELIELVLGWIQQGALDN